MFNPRWAAPGAAVLTLAMLVVATPAVAEIADRHAATVTLDGSWFLQAGQVLNHSDPDIRVTEFRYSMGNQEPGRGVWERYLETGQEEFRLAGTEAHYSSVVWRDLSVASGETMTFDGLDLDRIVGIVPAEVDSQNVDLSGESLRGAYVEVVFSDGLRGRAALAEAGWNVTQVLEIVAAPVPEAPSLALMAGGLVLVFLGRRRGLAPAG
jgi:hypothetical protein